MPRWICPHPLGKTNTVQPVGIEYLQGCSNLSFSEWWIWFFPAWRVSTILYPKVKLEVIIGPKSVRVLTKIALMSHWLPPFDVPMIHLQETTLSIKKPSTFPLNSQEADSKMMKVRVTQHILQVSSLRVSSNPPSYLMGRIGKEQSQPKWQMRLAPSSDLYCLDRGS